MKEIFCNECHLERKLPLLVACKLLGIHQLGKIRTRYRQMREGYDLSYPAWQEVFTDELKPFRGYTDTTSVTIPISQPFFKQDFESMHKGAIGLDLPTWYNMQTTNPRIMLIAQDPLRNKKWYGDCYDAVVSSPFGLHDATHCKRGNGGKMFYLLVEKLVGEGCAVYLTDANKFFIYDHAMSDAYSKNRTKTYAQILQKEINLVKPNLCVCLGNKATSVLEKCEVKPPTIKLPHLSGAARRAIIKRFPQLKETKATAEHVTDRYVAEIVRSLYGKCF